MSDMSNCSKANILFLEELRDDCINDGVALLDFPEEFKAEAEALATRVGASEEFYDANNLEHMAPKIFEGLVTPLGRMVKAKHTTISLIDQPIRKAFTTSHLHVDSYISGGMSLLVPISKSPAEFYHADFSAEFPDPAIDSLIYGVGQAVLLRQYMRVAASGNVLPRELPARFHGGWCEAGDRQILSIDFHNYGITL